MDKKEILKQLGNIPESVYDQIVLGFYDESRIQIKLIAQAIDASQWDTVSKLTHSIKGSSANLRLTQIQEAAKALQEALESNNKEEISKSFELLKLLIP